MRLVTLFQTETKATDKDPRKHRSYEDGDLVPCPVFLSHLKLEVLGQRLFIFPAAFRKERTYGLRMSWLIQNKLEAKIKRVKRAEAQSNAELLNEVPDGILDRNHAAPSLRRYSSGTLFISTTIPVSLRS